MTMSRSEMDYDDLLAARLLWFIASEVLDEADERGRIVLLSAMGHLAIGATATRCVESSVPLLLGGADRV
jgi:hypothetical protein